MTRRGSLSRGIRVAHRWISMVFTLLAAVLILPVLPQGAVFQTVSAVAIVLLIAMLLTGIWMAVRFYVLKSRRPRRTTREPIDV